LEFGTGAGDQKTRMMGDMGLPGRENTVWRYLQHQLHGCIMQYINVTDGRTDTGRQQRPLGAYA